MDAQTVLQTQLRAKAALATRHAADAKARADALAPALAKAERRAEEMAAKRRTLTDDFAAREDEVTAAATRRSSVSASLATTRRELEAAAGEAAEEGDITRRLQDLTTTRQVQEELLRAHELRVGEARRRATAASDALAAHDAAVALDAQRQLEAHLLEMGKLIDGYLTAAVDVFATVSDMHDAIRSGLKVPERWAPVLAGGQRSRQEKLSAALDHALTQRGISWSSNVRTRMGEPFATAVRHSISSWRQARGEAKDQPDDEPDPPANGNLGAGTRALLAGTGVAAALALILTPGLF